MEKHDSNPLVQTPLCHSEVNRQIIHQWDSIPPPLPPFNKDNKVMGFEAAVIS